MAAAGPLEHVAMVALLDLQSCGREHVWVGGLCRRACASCGPLSFLCVLSGSLRAGVLGRSWVLSASPGRSQPRQEEAEKVRQY